MTCWNLKHVPRRTVSDKVLRDKVFNIAKNPRYDGHQHGLALMVFSLFDKNYDLLADRSASKSDAVKGEIVPNRELAE